MKRSDDDLFSGTDTLSARLLEAEERSVEMQTRKRGSVNGNGSLSDGGYSSFPDPPESGMEDHSVESFQPKQLLDVLVALLFMGSLAIPVIAHPDGISIAYEILLFSIALSFSPHRISSFLLCPVAPKWSVWSSIVLTTGFLVGEIAVNLVHLASGLSSDTRSTLRSIGFETYEGDDGLLVLLLTYVLPSVAIFVLGIFSNRSKLRKGRRKGGDFRIALVIVSIVWMALLAGVFVWRPCVLGICALVIAITSLSIVLSKSFTNVLSIRLVGFIAFGGVAMAISWAILSMVKGDDSSSNATTWSGWESGMQAPQIIRHAMLVLSVTLSIASCTLARKMHPNVKILDFVTCCQKAAEIVGRVVLISTILYIFLFAGIIILVLFGLNMLSFVLLLWGVFCITRETKKRGDRLMSIILFVYACAWVLYAYIADVVSFEPDSDVVKAIGLDGANRSVWYYCCLVVVVISSWMVGLSTFVESGSHKKRDARIEAPKFVRRLVQYGYYVSLIVLLITCFTEYSVSYGFFLLFLLFFGASPEMAVKQWDLLVWYTSGFMAVLYVFNAWKSVMEPCGNWNGVVGLRCLSIVSLRWKMLNLIGLLACVSFQKHVFRWFDVKTLRHAWWRPNILFWLVLMPLSFITQFLTVTLREYSYITLCLLLFFFAFFQVLSKGSHGLDEILQTLRRMWPVFLLYSALVVVAKYIYQFQGVDRHAKNHWENEYFTMKDIGLQKYDMFTSFLHFLPDIFLLILSVIIIRVMTVIRERRLKGNVVPTHSGDVLEDDGNSLEAMWNSPKRIAFAQHWHRFHAIYGPKLAVFLLFVIAFVPTYFGVLGGLVTIVALLSLSSLRNKSIISSCFFSMVVLMGTIVARYMYQMRLLHDHVDHSLMKWVGLVKQDSVLDEGGTATFLVIALEIFVIHESRFVTFKNLTLFSWEMNIPLWKNTPFLSWNNVFYVIDAFYIEWGSTICALVAFMVAAYCNSIVSLIQVLVGLILVFHGSKGVKKIRMIFPLLLIISIGELYIHIGLPNGRDGGATTTHKFLGKDWFNYFSLKPSRGTVIGQFMLLMLMALLRKRKEREDDRQDGDIEVISPIQIWGFSMIPYIICGFCFLLSMTRRPNGVNLGYLILSLWHLCFSRNELRLDGVRQAIRVGFYATGVFLLQLLYQVPWSQMHDKDWRQNWIGLMQSDRYNQSLTWRHGFLGECILLALVSIQFKLSWSPFYMSFWNAFSRKIGFYGEFGVYLSVLRTQWKETFILGEKTERKMRDIRLMQVRETRLTRLYTGSELSKTGEKSSEAMQEERDAGDTTQTGEDSFPMEGPEQDITESHSIDVGDVVVEDGDKSGSFSKKESDAALPEEQIGDIKSGQHENGDDGRDSGCDENKKKDSKVEKVKKVLRKGFMGLCIFLIKNVIPSSSKDLDDPFLVHFATAAKKEKIELKEIKGDDFSYLLRSLFFSGTHVMAYAFAMLPFLVNANLLDMSIAMTIFFYHMLQVPLSRRKSWDRLLFFSIFVIAIKYLFNMPIFCVCHEQSADSLHMQPYCDHHQERCNFRPKGQTNTIAWFSFIGFVPKNGQNFTSFIEWNIISLLFLMMHKINQQSKGWWDVSSSPPLRYFGSSGLKLRMGKLFSHFCLPAFKIEFAPNDCLVVSKIPSSETVELDEKEAGGKGVNRLGSSEREEMVEKEDKEKEENGGLKARLKKIWAKCSFIGCRNNEHGYPRDYYKPMFIVEMCALIYLVLFWTSVMEQENQSVEEGIGQSDVPALFVIALITQSLFIVFDRILYLRGLDSWKHIFHMVSCILYLFLMPFFSDRVGSQLSGVNGSGGLEETLRPLGSYNPMKNTALLVFLCLKFVYLGVSAVQIGYHYPRQTSVGDVRELQYSWTGLILYTLYRVLPFVFEIRSIIDWTCKKTSLEIGQWFCLEDIFSELYVVKCHVEINRAEGRKMGEAQKISYKILAGAFLVVLLLIILFFPLIYYSTMNPNTVSNSVEDIMLTVGIKGFPSMYQTNQFASEVDLSHDKMLDITNAYRGVDLVQLYNTKMQVVSLYSYSDQTWQISPPAKEEIVSNLESSSVSLEIEYVFTRKGPQDNRIVSKQVDYALNVEQRDQFHTIITKDDHSQTVVLSGLYTPFIRLPAYSDPSSLDSSAVISCDMSYKISDSQNTTKKWWDITCQDPLSLSNTPGVYFVTVCDTIPSGVGFVGTFKTYSLIAFYITFVLAIGRFLRMAVTGQANRVVLSKMPEPMSLLQLVSDIFAARDDCDILLEEKLFRELIEIYRSPEAIIKMTEVRQKEE